MNTFLTISFLALINQYQITGDWGDKGLEAKPAEWVQCIKLVAGTDSDVEFCDHQFDPYMQLGGDEDEIAFQQWEQENPNWEAESMDGR